MFKNFGLDVKDGFNKFSKLSSKQQEIAVGLTLVVLGNIMLGVMFIFNTVAGSFNYSEFLIIEFGQLFLYPASDIAAGIIDLHHDIHVVLIFIFIFVSYALMVLIHSFTVRNWSAIAVERRKFTHNTKAEWIWTLIPTAILAGMNVPSTALLYAEDTAVSEPLMTIRIIGRQWYWSYEYQLDNTFIDFDSYMTPSPEYTYSFDDLTKLATFNALDTTEHLILPIHSQLRAVVTASDVIHSWAVPSLGIKIDACPGRYNTIFFTIAEHGHYFGQCSELCGVGHASMPISIVTTTV